MKRKLLKLSILPLIALSTVSLASCDTSGISGLIGGNGTTQNADSTKTVTLTLVNKSTDGTIETQTTQEAKYGVVWSQVSPKVENYSFEGWYFDADFTIAVASDWTPISNAKIYAKLVKETNAISVEKLQAELTELTTKINDLNVDVETKKAEIEALTKEKENNLAIIGTLTKEVEELEANGEVSEETISSLNNKIISLNKQVADYEATIQTLMQTKTNLEKNVANLTTQVNDLTKQVKLYSGQAKALSNKADYYYSNSKLKVYYDEYNDLDEPFEIEYGNIESEKSEYFNFDDAVKVMANGAIRINPYILKSGNPNYCFVEVNNIKISFAEFIYSTNVVDADNCTISITLSNGTILEDKKFSELKSLQSTYLDKTITSYKVNLERGHFEASFDSFIVFGSAYDLEVSSEVLEDYQNQIETLNSELSNANKTISSLKSQVETLKNENTQLKNAGSGNWKFAQNDCEAENYVFDSWETLSATSYYNSNYGCFEVFPSEEDGMDTYGISDINLTYNDIFVEVTSAINENFNNSYITFVFSDGTSEKSLICGEPSDKTKVIKAIYLSFDDGFGITGEYVRIGERK